MALPPGITPKTVTLGIASFADGSLASGRATISLNVNVIHTPTNRPIFSSDMTKPFVDGVVTFDLLPTDAPGLNRVDFSYHLKVEVQGANKQPDPIDFLLPTAGPDTVDLDGLVTVPSSAGIPISVDVLTAGDLDPLTAGFVADTDSQTGVALRAAFGSVANTYDIRTFVQTGEQLIRDGTGPGDNSAILQRAVNALTALGVPATIYLPAGRYVLADSGTVSGAHYAVQWKTRVGLRGESEASTVILSDATSTPLFGAYGPQLVDCSFCDFTVDCAAQTNASYTTQLKGMFMQDMLRPRWSHVTIKNAWGTGLGCDFLPDGQIDQVTTTGNGRGIGVTGVDPLAVSGGSGVGIGTGKYQSEPLVITGLTSKGNGRGGLFFEKQTSVSYYSRGTKVVGAVLVGNAFGLQDCGCDGLDADITATDNSYAGVLLDGTVLAGNAGYNGRITGRFDRNGSASNPNSGNVVLGTMPSGGYRIGGAGSSAKSSPKYGVVSRAGANLGPGIALDLIADGNGAAGTFIQQASATVRALSISGSARNNGQDAAQARREGVVIAADTDMLEVAATCTDDQAAPTQTVGLYVMGAGRTLNRGKLTGDVRGNATAPFTNEQTISNDTIQALRGADTTNPSALRVTGVGDGTVSLAWSAPIPASDVTDYAVQYRTNPGGTWTTWAHTASTTPSATVTGLSNGVAYDFQVAKVTGAGTGAFTAGPVTATPQAADLYADSFNRANGALAGSTAPSGTSTAAWALYDGGTGGVWSIQSNRARPTAGSGNVVAYLDTTHADGSVHVTIPAVSGVPACGIAFRIQDATNFLTLSLRQTGSIFYYTLQAKVGGTNTNLITTTTVPAANDVVRVTFSGQTVKMFVNGVLAGTATTDTTAKGSGLMALTKHGLWGNFAIDTSTSFDDWGYNTAVA